MAGQNPTRKADLILPEPAQHSFLGTKPPPALPIQPEHQAKAPMNLVAPAGPAPVQPGQNAEPPHTSEPKRPVPRRLEPPADKKAIKVEQKQDR
jgi:hypothetical protein